MYFTVNFPFLLPLRTSSPSFFRGIEFKAFNAHYEIFTLVYYIWTIRLFQRKALYRDIVVKPFVFFEFLVFLNVISDFYPNFIYAVFSRVY